MVKFFRNYFIYFINILILFCILKYYTTNFSKKKNEETPKYEFVNKTENCTKETNIVFLKTHKTASSTIQNIFFRYGIANNLWFGMPVKGNTHLLGKSFSFFRFFFVFCESV